MLARLRHDARAALALATLLSLIWAWQDWANLSILRLPDTDDVVRLQQIRDWLGGQRWSDLTEHRLGPAPGLPMHWSRLADLGPGAIIAGLTPWFGAFRAELIAMLLWPGLLFALALILIARIARQAGGNDAALPTMIVAALAYPATTIFLPGRIDHHGLQVVLLLGTVVGLLASGGRGAGTAALCAGAGLIVGLETTPLLALAGLWLVACWAQRRATGRVLGAFAIGTFAALAIGRALFASDAFAYPACDGFTHIAWRAALIGMAGLMLLALLDGALPGRRARWIAALTLGGGTGALMLGVSLQCLHPYGAVDPRIAALWLHQVGEAQSILAAPFATSFGYAGLALAGFVATIWQALLAERHHADRAGPPPVTPRQPGAQIAAGRASDTRGGWNLIALLLAGALAIAAVQLRGAYPAALLASPALAAMMAVARKRGPVALTASWLAAAGIVYPLVAGAVPMTADPAPVGRGDCGAPAMIAALARLPHGRVLAPVDAGAWIIGGTADTVLAAPYHRDGAGLRAVYAFYAAPAGDAAATADRLDARYLLACAALPGAHRPGSTAAVLARGSLPGFTTVVGLPDGARILVRNRLSRGAPPA